MRKLVFLITLLIAIPLRLYPEKLKDNSFLIEEAYNQEPGVIQHIFNSQIKRDGDAEFSFTDEWPLYGQTSQISATINWNDYLGDILINYRYQLILNDKVALVPRLSIILPTRDEKYSSDPPIWGGESNLCLSLDLLSWLDLHLNAGARYDFTNNKVEETFGGSYVLVLTKNIEFLNEYLLKINDKSEYSSITGGGLRIGIDVKEDLQIVLGLGLYRDFKEWYNFLIIYLSIEHKAF